MKVGPSSSSLLSFSQINFYKRLEGTIELARAHGHTHIVQLLIMAGVHASEHVEFPVGEEPAIPDSEFKAMLDFWRNVEAKNHINLANRDMYPLLNTRVKRIIII